MKLDRLLNFHHLFQLISLLGLSYLLLSCNLSSVQPQPLLQPLNTHLKSIQTLDVTAEDHKLHALFSGVDEQNSELVLRYMQSVNAGKDWKHNVKIDLPHLDIKKSKRGNDFQIAAAGQTIMVVWRNKGSDPWVGIIAVAISRDNGLTWQQVASPIGQEYSNIDQGYFDLTADKKGNFHLVWLDDREEAGNTQGVRFASYQFKDNSAQWVYHNTLETTACTCCWVQIDSDKHNNLHVLYRDDSPRDMRVISSFNGGIDWQPSQPIYEFNWQFVGCPHQGGGIVSDELNGGIVLHHLIWTGKGREQGLYYQQTNKQGEKLASVFRVGDNTSSSGAIALLDNQLLGIVYTSGFGESKQVAMQISQNHGQSWSPVYTLSNLGSEPSHPIIIATQEGFRVFWTEWKDDGNAIAVMSSF